MHCCRSFLLTLLILPLLALQACVPVIVAGAATGAAVAHDRRTFGSMVDDENIEIKASTAITFDKTLKNAVHINVTSVNGIVLLTGEATTTEARDQVLRHVREINGVRRTTNEMRIAEPSTIGSRSQDSLITSAVKSRLLVTRGVDPTRIKVVTEAGAVYLMGLVKHTEGDVAAERATTIDGVARVVKIFEYID
jgi:osmotically-inducible protein OsmY